MRFYIIWACAVQIFCLSFFSLRSNTSHENNGADLIVFSRNRPLQLYAYLESLERYVVGANTVMILYRADNDQYADAYRELQRRFESILFVEQPPHIPSEATFKPLLLRLIEESPSLYLIFAVDDIIITDYINLIDCSTYLEQTGAYAFYLRLGTNLEYCYASNKAQGVPPLQMIDSKVYTWQFKTGQYGWAYPNNVDMTLYRKKDIEAVLYSMNYRSPNTFESSWAGNARYDLWGLCYHFSKLVNIPLNIVQSDFHNRNMQSYSPEKLLDLFNKQLKIDIDPLYKILNKSVHMEYEFSFIPRT